ncbi:hypothetical protein K1X76_04105 [bacterium]|nr:hypothetical protein [bacterium]
MNLLSETLKLELIKTLLKATEQKGNSKLASALKNAESTQLLIRNLGPAAKGSSAPPQKTELSQVAYATLLSETVEPLLELLGQSTNLNTQDKSIHTRQLIPLFKEIPLLIDDFIKIWDTLKKNAAPQKTYNQLVSLFENLKFSFIGDETHPVPPSTTGPILNLRMAAKFIADVLEGATPPKLIANNPQTPPLLNLEEALSFIVFSLDEHKENPEFFKADLMGYGTALKAGLDSKTYIQMAHHSHPLKIARLLLAASGKNLKSLILNLKEASHEPEKLKKVIFDWSKKLDVKDLPELKTTAKRNAMGVLEIAPSDKKEMPVVFMDTEEGVIASQAISFMDPPFETLLNGHTLSLAAYPPGLHRLKIKINRGKKRAPDLMELLFHIVAPDSEEAAPAPVSAEEREQMAKYADISDVKPIFTAGKLEVTLKAPTVLLFSQINEAKTAPAALHMEFGFLSEFVSPAFKASREHFLSFNESKELLAFRNSLKALSENGIAAFNDYNQALSAMMDNLKKMVAPHRVKSFEEARIFLRDEVLAYLMGKKIFEKQLEMSEGDKRSEILACVCQTAANIHLASHQVGDAMVHMMDARRYAANKTGVERRMLGFFNVLRQQMGLPEKTYKELDNWVGSDYRVQPGQNYYTTSKESDLRADPLVTHFLKAAVIV